VTFEAIKEEQPDWRQPGEALCPERRPLAKLLKIKSKITSYFWNALFQQRPRPKEGGAFKRSWFEIVDAVPNEATRVRYWDHAATEGGGDFTAGVLMSEAKGTFYIEDVQRGRWSSGKRDAEIKETAERDKARYQDDPPEQWAQQEPGSGGKDAAIAFVRLLVGHTARTEPASGSKEVRAGPLASAAEVGNVKLKRGPWNNAFLDELCDFPLGSNDDQVDGAAGAFNKLAAEFEGIWAGSPFAN